MKILIMSDSHSSLAFMRRAIEKLSPHVVVHLGDHYEDGTAMQEENPNIRFYQVPGNCDRFGFGAWQPDVLCCDIGGVLCFMTHGHKHGVKSGDSRLLTAATEAGAGVTMYGHTHDAVCRKEGELLVVNPGSCRGYGGTVALLEIENKEVSSCRILGQEDLMEPLCNGQEKQ